MHPRAILRATGGGTLVLGENNIVEECAEIVNRCDAVDERGVNGARSTSLMHAGCGRALLRSVGRHNQW